jgi:hypothetical protein
MSTGLLRPPDQTIPAPRPTSYAGRVYDYVKNGSPRSVIERETGLTGMQLTDAIRSNYRLGYLPTPPLTERRQRLRLNTSAGKGGIWLSIRDYVPLCLTARQTQAAIRQDTGRRLSLGQIQSAYSRERHRNQLARPVTELTVEAQRDKHRTERALLEIVRLRRAVRQFLTERGMEGLGTLKDRINLSFVEKLSELGLVNRNYTEWLLLLRLYERHGRSPVAQRVWLHKAAERSFIKQSLGQESDLLEHLFEHDPENMPATAWGRSQLLDFHHGLDVFTKTGDATLLHEFPSLPAPVMRRVAREIAQRNADRGVGPKA